MFFTTTSSPLSDFGPCTIAYPSRTHGSQWWVLIHPYVTWLRKIDRKKVTLDLFGVVKLKSRRSDHALLLSFFFEFWCLIYFPWSRWLKPTHFGDSFTTLINHLCERQKADIWEKAPLKILGKHHHYYLDLFFRWSLPFYFSIHGIHHHQPHHHLGSICFYLFQASKHAKSEITVSKTAKK